LKRDKRESVNIASTSKGTGKQKRKVNSDAATISSQKKPTKVKKSAFSKKKTSNRLSRQNRIRKRKGISFVNLKGT
jgi:hypothetical protein